MVRLLLLLLSGIPLSMLIVGKFGLQGIIIGIKHVFPCINVYQVPRELLKTEAEGRGFQQLPRDLANVNALEKQYLIAVIA